MTQHPSDLSLRVAVDRPLAWEGGDSVRYLAAEVTAPRLPAESAPAERPPLNLAVVIDASGSMSGRPLQAAKEAACGVVEALRDHDRLSVVSFASDVMVHVDGVEMNAAGRALAAAAVARLETRGNTNLAAGWMKGAECAATVMERLRGSSNRVLLLSDGHANEGILDPAVLEQHAAELRRRGLLTSTVGIGDGYSSTQLQALAEHGGGTMHDAEHPHEIVEVVLAELGDISATTAEDVITRLSFPGSVSVEVVGPFPSLQAAGRIEASLGALREGASRSVVFRLHLPRGEAKDRLAFEASATWRMPGREGALGPVEAGVRITFAPGAENSGQERDAAVSLVVSRAWHAVVVRRAVDLNRRGAGAEIERYLRRELKHFRPYCDGLAGAADLVDEIEHMLAVARRQWDERGRKEMELASYRTATGVFESRAAPRSSRLSDWLPGAGPPRR